jgi:molybdate transport system substrate-binding protein
VTLAAIVCRETLPVAAALNVLCAGAAQGLVDAMRERFECDHGIALNTRFGAVGAMRDALHGGAPCDVLIVSEAMIDSLLASGALRSGSAVPLGRVATALAVVSGASVPNVARVAALKSALLRASALYFPDATLSTAGTHVVSMLDRLGIATALAPRLRMFANGRTAMRALAEAADPDALGCTQASEIVVTPGISLVGALPAPYALATVYSAAVPSVAASNDLARRFIALLADAESLAQRRAAGFDEVTA